MRSIDDVVKEKWFRQRYWLIVGTGPSLARWKPKMIRDFNIWTINAAVNITTYADICAMHDGPIYGNYFGLSRVPDARYFLTRTSNKESQTFQPSVFVQLEGDPPTGLPEHTRHNSSGFAWYFLGKVCGFKTIYSIGIDGGTEISDSLSDEYIKHEAGQNFDLHNHAMGHYQRECGYEIIKL